MATPELIITLPASMARMPEAESDTTPVVAVRHADGFDHTLTVTLGATEPVGLRVVEDGSVTISLDDQPELTLLVLEYATAEWTAAIRTTPNELERAEATLREVAASVTFGGATR